MRKHVIDLPPEFQQALIRCQCHLGGRCVTSKFEDKIYGKRKDEGINIIDIDLMWEKILIAARAFCSIENPADVVVTSSREFGKKAVLRFCEYTGATSFIGRFVPGSFTNQEISKVREPRLIIVADPYTDKQTIKEASYVNTPCIAFCNIDNDINFIDIAIPMNNRSINAIGAGFCILAKVICYMKGHSGLVDNLKYEIERYFYRDSAELKELAAEQEGGKTKDDVTFVNARDNFEEEKENE